jgi:hypothetical protein
MTTPDPEATCSLAIGESGGFATVLQSHLESKSIAKPYSYRTYYASRQGIAIKLHRGCQFTDRRIPCFACSCRSGPCCSFLAG